MTARTRIIATLAPLALVLAACTVNVGDADDTASSVPALPDVPAAEARDHTDTTEHDRKVTLFALAFEDLTASDQSAICTLWDQQGTPIITESVNDGMTDPANYVTDPVVDDVLRAHC